MGTQPSWVPNPLVSCFVIPSPLAKGGLDWIYILHFLRILSTHIRSPVESSLHAELSTSRARALSARASHYIIQPIVMEWN